MQKINNQFLEKVYEELNFNTDSLIEIDSTIEDNNLIDKIEWLNLCKYINSKNSEFKAEKVFFIENNPLIVFVNILDGNDDSLHNIYNQIWCMARPSLLFLATTTEISVYDLNNKPFKTTKELKSNALEIVKATSEIQEKLNNFRREFIESGKVFQDHRFGKLESRADKSLINDLKTVREKLISKGLNGKKLKYAHALIGRSIFIRYLEDRGILTDKYFFEVAKSNNEWISILENEPIKTYISPEMSNLFYPKVLGNINFTYELFDKLTKDFNGDMFITDSFNSEDFNERQIVTQEHLDYLQEFLMGDIQSQKSLFFWAYKFDIIPVELISNIYEEFYHERKSSKKDDKGTFYTSPSLVEFVLSRVLTENKLKDDPIIIDPACGSGIFLVEAFRKIVRYKISKQLDRTTLSFNELLTILENQIRGIELNEEALKITAFSLYLSFLHYQEPPDILKQIKNGNKLPHLIYTKNKKSDEKYFDVLIHSNAFAIETSINDNKISQKFLNSCADIVIGNPPWVSINPKKDIEGRKVLQWCKNNYKTISDNDTSEAFIFRALDLLKEGGVSGLLVKSSIFFKHSDKNYIFRKDWLTNSRLIEVINFAHVRDVFFNKATSPFVFINFEKNISTNNSYIHYWSAKKTEIINNTKCVILDKNDFKLFKYSDTRVNDIWKIYWFGNHRDYSLISGLRLYNTLGDLTKISSMGITEGTEKKNFNWLKEYKILPTENFTKYSKSPKLDELSRSPFYVERSRNEEIYKGNKLLIKRGITQDITPKGQIITRLETEDITFLNSIIGIKLKEDDIDNYKLILGILWSSLSRYYFFMTAGTWGTWHHEVHQNEILRLPISLPEDDYLKNDIISVVDELRNKKYLSTYSTQNYDNEFIEKIYIDISKNVFKELHNSKKMNNLKIPFKERIPNIIEKHLEEKLDDLIFDLYMLDNSEIDLIKDRCKYDIEFFYNSKSEMVSHPNFYSGFSNLNFEKEKVGYLGEYLEVLLNLWNQSISEDKTLKWEIIYPPNLPIISIILTLFDKNDIYLSYETDNKLNEWKNVLISLDKSLKQKISDKIFTEGIVRVVTKEQIIIIKRNEKMFWTRSCAREDVEATIIQEVSNN